MNEPTVLIVEDVQVMQQMLTMALMGLGLTQIITCADAVEVEAAIASHVIDLAFLDIQMPGKNGLDVLQDLLAAQPSAYAVMVSGQGGLATIQKALALGARGFIVKPYTSAKIKDALAKFQLGASL